MNLSEIKENDVIYRCMGENLDNGILSCGFMRKRTTERSQYNFKIGYYSCFVLLSGSGHYITETGDYLPLTAGSVVQRLPNKVHSTEVTADGEWLEFYLSIGYPAYLYLHNLGLINSTVPVSQIRVDDSMIHEFTSFLSKLKMTADNLLPDALFSAQKIIFQLYHSTYTTGVSPHKQAVDKACQILGRANTIHYDVKETAAAVNMGYESLRKIFKQETGISLKQYHLEQIMKQAKMMLLSGIPIKQTAAYLGYGDIYSFTKQFTKSVGISPGKYRILGR